MKNKIVCRIIAVVLAVLTASGTGAAGCFAADGTVPVCRSEEEAASALREAMTGRQESAVLCLVTDIKASDSEELIGDIFEMAMEHTGNPVEGDYLRFQYDNCSASAKPVSAGGDDAVLITYSLSYYDNAGQETELDARISGILEELDLEGKSDYEKTEAIYRYLCENVEYDYDNLTDQDYHLKHTAYAALVDGKAVCQGYSAALYRLLLEAGVDNRIIYGTSTGIGEEIGEHTWNIVDIDGKYYNTDVTSDDENGNTVFFLRGAGFFDDDHVRSEDYLAEKFTEKYEIADSDYASELDIIIENAKAVAGSIREVFAGLVYVIRSDWS